MTSVNKSLEVLDIIIQDIENDVAEFEGKPFTGKTLGQLHGNLCATVQALAKIMKKHLEECSLHDESEGPNNWSGGASGEVAV